MTTTDDTATPVPVPAAADDVVIPLAIYSEANHRKPGTAVVCGPCATKSWYPKSKHGSALLLESIDQHIGHTRQEKTHG